MTEKEWLEKYSEQATDELLALQNTHRTDSLALAFEEAIQRKADRGGLKALNEAEYTVLAVEALEREVNNGGFSQFFGNTSGQYADGIVDALIRIGASGAADLARSALDSLGIEGPVTWEAVEDAAVRDDEAMEETLDGLDFRYYEEIGDLSAELLKYIAGNRESIILPPPSPNKSE